MSRDKLGNNDDDLIFLKEGPITRIILNRPHACNALTMSVQKKLHEAVRKVRFDSETRVVIFEGRGGHFCAGDDIKEMPILGTRVLSADVDGIVEDADQHDPHSYFNHIRMFQETAAMVEDLDAITISKVEGVCMGGGLELTLCCDFVLATEDSRWGMPEVDMGITPGWGGCTRMQRFTGRRKAKEINLVAYEFSGVQAEEFGFINRLVANDELEAETMALANLMLAKNRYALRRSKFVLNKAAEGHMAQAAAFEVPVDPNAGLGSGLDGINAFAEKNMDWLGAREKSKTFWQD